MLIIVQFLKGNLAAPSLYGNRTGIEWKLYTDFKRLFINSHGTYLIEKPSYNSACTV